MKTFEEIRAVLQSHKDYLKSRFKVKEIGIFGSFARGENRRRSDVDLLVEFEEMPGFLAICEMENYIERLVKRKVDLVRRGAIRQELRDIILSEVVFL